MAGVASQRAPLEDAGQAGTPGGMQRRAAVLLFQQTAGAMQNPFQPASPAVALSAPGLLLPAVQVQTLAYKLMRLCLWW